MKNTIKIVFLGIIGFTLLVYLTAPKNPTKIENGAKFEKSRKITLDSFPRFFDVVSKSEYTKYTDIFGSKKQQYLVVLNHDCLAVFNELYKNTKKDIILVANISNTPWLIKKLAVNGKLEELYKNSTIPLINDNDGILVKILDIKDNTQNSYTVFKIGKNREITKLFTQKVKLNALQEGISKEEIKKDINKFLSNIK